MTAVIDALPEIAAVAPNSAADRAGLKIADKVTAVNGVSPRDIIEWYHLVDNELVELSILRDGEPLLVQARRNGGEAFGAEVSSSVFDRVQTCDNHCEFCFIYQLPKGMRRSLYLKDDDYRLSFLYGNFTTLTRFTEADFERVISERLSPLYVSIHATNPRVRSEMLRNSRGGFSLRWAKELMNHGVELRGQIVLCPGVNDRDELDRTILDALDSYSTFTSIAIVPVGLSKHNSEARMRVHTAEEARQVVEQVTHWQKCALETIGRRFFFLADEFYLLAEADIPPADHYEGFDMLEDGIGLARNFLDSFFDASFKGASQSSGFFASVSARETAATPSPTDYVRNPAADTSLRARREQQVVLRPRFSRFGSVCVITGECSAPIVSAAVRSFGDDRLRVSPVTNNHFGGSTSVTGLLTGEDVRRFIEHDQTMHQSRNTLYVLPDVCLNHGRFLDGASIAELQEAFPLHVLPTEGSALRQFLVDYVSAFMPEGDQ